MDIVAVLMDFQRLEKIDGEIVVSVLKLFAEKEKRRKVPGYMLLVTWK